MNQLLVAVIGLSGGLLGVLFGAWRQAILQRTISQTEDLRRWRQERRESYLRFVFADDDLYRGIIRDLRDMPPGRSTDDPKILGAADFLLPPLSREQRLEVLSIFDRVWRAKREIELFHLVDDELLASAEKLMLVDSEIVGLMLFDVDRMTTEAVTARAVDLFQERRLRIADFMSNARTTLDVPSADGMKQHRNRRTYYLPWSSAPKRDNNHSAHP
jgi:hypothetical protein